MNPPAAAGIVSAGGVASEAAPSRNDDVPAAAAENIDDSPVAEDSTLLGMRHRQYKGFWLPEFIVKGVGNTCFNPNPSDIFLASLLKSGTTWLKALAFATLNRATYSPSDSQHPRRHQNPHDCVPFMEFMTIQADDDRATTTIQLPSPRLLYAHMPYSLLPRYGITDQSKIVYVCRDPKDVLVSYWNFSNKAAATLAVTAATAGGGGERDESAAEGAGGGLMMSFEETFEQFCEGRFSGGPHWLHVLEFWHESQRRPSKVMFLRYEDMLGDPAGHLRKLAAFMGCAFSEEDQQAGGPDQIVELCSLQSLKSLDVNKNGTTVMGVRNESLFFRKGQVGDWKNYMTVDMAARLDKIAEEATRGSGLSFGN